MRAESEALTLSQRWSAEHAISLNRTPFESRFIYTTPNMKIAFAIWMYISVIEIHKSNYHGKNLEMEIPKGFFHRRDPAMPMSPRSSVRADYGADRRGAI